MSCVARRDALLLYAFDQLDPEAVAPLEAHLRSGCPSCIGELAAARAIAGAMLVIAPPSPPSPAVRDRVLAVTRSVTDGASPRRSARWPAFAATALFAAGIMGFAILAPARREIDRLRTAVTAAQDSAQAFQLRAATAEQKLRALGSPATRIFAMETAGPQPEATARIFWDESRGAWIVFFSNMKTPDPGRTYQLWFITPDQAKISAGTFMVDASGNASVDVAVPKDLGVIALAAVTEEPEGGVPQPTGAIQLVGKLGT